MADGGKRILVVDDEPDAIAFIAMVLEENGYEVTCVSTADEAYDTAMRLRPDLLCMDIMMPRKSGLLCYRRLRAAEETKEIPVLIISGFGHPRDFEEDRFRVIVGDDGVPAPQGYLEKPVTPEQLLEAVRRIL